MKINEDRSQSRATNHQTHNVGFAWGLRDAGQRPGRGSVRSGRYETNHGDEDTTMFGKCNCASLSVHSHPPHSFEGVLRDDSHNFRRIAFDHAFEAKSVLHSTIKHKKGVATTTADNKRLVSFRESRERNVFKVQREGMPDPAKQRKQALTASTTIQQCELRNVGNPLQGVVRCPVTYTQKRILFFSSQTRVDEG